MKVGLIAPAHHPIVEPYAGGMESHTAELATRLRELGHQVAVFGASGSDPDLVEAGDELAALSHSEAAARDVSAAPEAFMAQHHAYLALMLRLRREPDRFDVVHDNALHYLTLSMADLVGTPMVATLHTPPTPWFESAVKAGPMPRTTFCAVSRRNARSWAGVLGTVPVIHNGVDVDTFAAGPGGGTPVWTGRLVPEKGADHAVAAARLAGTGLILAGPIVDEAWYAARVAPLMGGDVRYAGHLSQRELASLVGNAAAAIVTPRWDEPYALVVAEALSCGTPVAAYDRGAIGEIVDPATGRLARRDDIPGLARALVAAMSLDRGEARRRAVELWSSRRMARRYAQLYATLLGRPAGTAGPRRTCGE